MFPKNDKKFYGRRKGRKISSANSKLVNDYSYKFYLKEDHICKLKNYEYNKNILEIGSGCGYQSAVLSYFTNQLYAIERIKPLVIKSRKNIEFLKIKNVIFKHGDGHIDWPEDIIFDGVLGAAAPRAFPQDLLKPLKDGGKVVFPVGNDKSQTLKVVIKNKDETEEQSYDEVSFVPMLGGTSIDGKDL